MDWLAPRSDRGGAITAGSGIGWGKNNFARSGRRCFRPKSCASPTGQVTYKDDPALPILPRSRKKSQKFFWAAGLAG